MKINLILAFSLLFILPVTESQQESQSIVLKQPFNVEISISQYSGKAYLDFNPRMQIITLIIQIKALFVSVQVFKAEIDLNNLVLTFKKKFSDCQIYNLALFQNQGKERAKKSFFTNMFFKFIGQLWRDGQRLKKFIFDPFSFVKNQTQFQIFGNFGKQLYEGMKEIQELQDINISDLKYGLFVYIDSEGNPRYLSFNGKQATNYNFMAKFELKTNINQRMDCRAWTKTLTNDQLRGLIANTISGGDLSKYFK